MGKLPLMLTVLAGITCLACEPRSAPQGTDVQESLDVAADVRVEPVAPATLEQKIQALESLGVTANTSQLRDSIRLDMAHPFHSAGNYLYLHATPGSTHSSGGFTTLIPPYEISLLGESSERTPTVVLRLDPKNFVRLVDCQGNGRPNLTFALKDTASVFADPISQSVVTASAGHWYFVVPASDGTGFANSDYVHITLSLPDGPIEPPIDVRLTGCDITSVD